MLCHVSKCGGSTHKCHDASTPDGDSSMRPFITELIDQLRALRNEVHQMKSNKTDGKGLDNASGSNSITTIQNVSGDNNTIVTNNNQSFNISLMPFGCERMDHIMPWMLLDALRDPKSGMTDLLHLIHYHEEVPENHNITIPNINKPFALVVGRNGQWMKRNKTEVIDQMLNKSHFLMRDYLKKGDLSKLDDDEVDDAILYLNRSSLQHDPKGWSAQRTETELVILNNRHKVQTVSKSKT